jgi:hypothetical protein
MITEMNGRGLLALVIQFALPLLVGLLTKQSWPAGLKAVLLLLLTAVAQFCVQLQDHLSSPDTAFDLRSILYATAIGFVVSVAVHFGLWRPTGAADAAGRTLVADSSSGR